MLVKEEEWGLRDPWVLSRLEEKKLEVQPILGWNPVLNDG